MSLRGSSAWGTRTNAGALVRLSIDRLTRPSSDRKKNPVRGALDAGGDPALIAGRIGETTTIKKAAQARLGRAEAPPQRMAEDQSAWR